MAAKRVSISSSSCDAKVPFLIGVAGGTASGKVSFIFLLGGLIELFFSIVNTVI